MSIKALSPYPGHYPTECHGGKIGRIWPMRSGNCSANDGGKVVYDEREIPCCSICGLDHGIEECYLRKQKVDPAKIARYRKLKALKRAGIL